MGVPAAPPPLPPLLWPVPFPPQWEGVGSLCGCILHFCGDGCRAPLHVPLASPVSAVWGLLRDPFKLGSLVFLLLLLYY